MGREGEREGERERERERARRRERRTFVSRIIFPYSFLDITCDLGSPSARASASVITFSRSTLARALQGETGREFTTDPGLEAVPPAPRKWTARYVLRALLVLRADREENKRECVLVEGRQREEKEREC